MDAFTSFELEAQRRREILEIDRRRARAAAADLTAERTPISSMVMAPAAARLSEPRIQAGDCQPARQPAPAAR